MWLFIAFLTVPLIEIALFIQVGGFIGLWPTLGIVVITAIIGTVMVKAQGLRALSELQTSLERAGDPAEPLVHGAMILFAGALLLTPGFFTDAVGFALLIPTVRRAAFAHIKQKVVLRTASFVNAQQRQHDRQSGVYEGEFHEIDPEREKLPRGDGNGNPGDSGWTRH